jgi:tetratricopeptide (TPR) repeat protein
VILGLGFVVSAGSAAGQGNQDQATRIQQKIERLHGLVQQRQKEGADLQPVGELMQDFEPLMQQQKFAEAEALLDRALELVNKLGSPTPTGPPPSLRVKMQRLQALFERKQQAGADLQPVGELMQDFEPLMQQQKFTEAEALVDRALKLLGEPEPPAPQPPPGTTPGVAPQSLQEKMVRLQTLAQQRQQAGADMQPIVEITQGVQPLLEQQKFSEAEALVDRALKLISEPAATEERPAAGSNQKQPAAPAAASEDHAAAKPFPCPAAGAAIDLASGDWALRSDCTAGGLSLRGEAQLWVEGLALTVDGNIKLEQNAGLHIVGGSFTLANHTVFEHRIQAKGNALFDIRDATMSTNAGVAGNLTSNYDGADDSRLHIDNVRFDYTTSWLLVNLHDRARLETKDSPNLPAEIYPEGNSNVRIEGERSGSGVWLYFRPGSSAVLDNLPASHPYTFSFGRNTPGVTGIGYQVDVVQGNAGMGIFSFPRSKVTVRNNPTNVGLNYLFSDVTAPETLTGLQGGRQTRTYENQGRLLALENAELPPFGWQVYSANDGIPLASVAPVNVSDSLINEMGAMARGRFEVRNVQFAFALIAAVGPSSSVHVRDSVINSQTILAQSDGVIRIEDSEIHGALVQATDSSRILLLNNALRTNERHPKCVPLLPSLDGSPPTRCNPFNPAREVQFVARGQGAVLVAGLDPIATAIRSGGAYAFVGDAIVKTPEDRPYTYNLRYRQTSASAFTAIVTGATGPKRAQPLGQLDTTGLAPGDYLVELELMAPGLEPVTVRRPFTITVP